MKLTVLIILIIGFLSSCSDRNSIIGTWIEQDNFINPSIYEIGQDYYRILNEPISEKRIYKVKKDTFFFNDFLGLDKVRFEVIGNQLLFYSANSDSILSKFERNTYRNFIDYFNVKKNTSIMLPVVKAKEISWNNNINTFVFDIENDYSVFFNGERYKLNNSTYLKLLPCVDDYITGNENNLVFCDNKIKLYELNELKAQLQKARRNRITYVTQDSWNNLMGLRVMLPHVESNLPDSLMQKYPPPPPPPPAIDFHHFNSNNVLCKVDKTGKEFNGEKIKSEELDSILTERIKSSKRLVVNVYFDEKMDFESYLIGLSQLRNVYYSLRNEYSGKLYNEFQYENLDLDKQDKIKTLYPMLIREIDKEEYEMLKKYAL